MDILKELEQEAHKQIPLLETRLDKVFGRKATVRQYEASVALGFASTIENHHLLTYQHSLRTSLEAHDMLDFIQQRVAKGDLSGIPIPENLAENLARNGISLPRTGLYGGLLHDVGKTQISLVILDKSYTGEIFTPEDRQTMEAHPVIGFELLAGSKDRELLMSSWIALNHHRYQTDPYPRTLPTRPKVNLTTQALMDFVSRIVAIADRYDSLDRVAISRGKDKLNRTEAEQYLVSRNSQDASLIRVLYENKVFS